MELRSWLNETALKTPWSRVRVRDGSRDNIEQASRPSRISDGRKMGDGVPLHLRDLEALGGTGLKPVTHFETPIDAEIPSAQGIVCTTTVVTHQNSSSSMDIDDPFIRQHPWMEDEA